MVSAKKREPLLPKNLVIQRFLLVAPVDDISNSFLNRGSKTINETELKRKICKNF